MDHAGIYVHRQITDEKQWARAMQAIHKEFCEDDVFVEKKWTLKEQAPPDDPMYWIKMTRAISEDDVVELRYAELLNFGSGVNFYHWEPLAQLVEMGFENLESLDEVATQGKELLTEALKAPTQDPFEINGAKESLAKIRSLAQNIRTLPPEEQTMVFKLSKERKLSNVRPPTLFEFSVGDRPSLPLFGRHFRIMESKLGGHCDIADGYIRLVYRVLKEFFPNHVFNEPPLMMQVKLGEPGTSTEEFYNKLRGKVKDISEGQPVSGFSRSFHAEQL